MSKYNEAAERIMVALDVPSVEEADLIIRDLQGIPCWMKVGMQLYYAAGPQFVLKLKNLGYKVFLDLKLHDIPNTVQGGSGSLARLGVDMFNVHAAGGVKMMKAALSGVEEAIASGQTPYDKGQLPILIAVTQLTSTDRSMLNDEIGISGTVEDTVVRFAQLAQQAGLHGVVASPLEVAEIKQHCGRSFITVTPGIRPSGASIGDQSRIMTPAEAFAQGTDYVVIGRPITAAENRRYAMESILEELI
ncbi:MAG: orotidine-5'-phosphate decarboxylase [Paenibacillaceae bacterium]